MGAVELRNIVLKYIHTADDHLLRVVKAMIESYQEEEIVAYTVEGKPLTKSEYRQELLAAETEIEKGEYITQEDFEKEAENW